MSNRTGIFAGAKPEPKELFFEHAEPELELNRKENSGYRFMTKRFTVNGIWDFPLSRTINFVTFRALVRALNIKTF